MWISFLILIKILVTLWPYVKGEALYNNHNQNYGQFNQNSDDEYGTLKLGYRNNGYSNYKGDAVISGEDTPATLDEIEDSYDDSLARLKHQTPLYEAEFKENYPKYPLPVKGTVTDVPLSVYSSQQDSHAYGFDSFDHFDPNFGLGGSIEVHYPPKEHKVLGDEFLHNNNFKGPSSTHYFRPSEPYEVRGPSFNVPAMSSGFKPSFGPPTKPKNNQIGDPYALRPLPEVQSHRPQFDNPLPTPLTNFEEFYRRPYPYLDHSSSKSVPLVQVPSSSSIKSTTTASKSLSTPSDNSNTEYKVVFIKAPSHLEHLDDRSLINQYLLESKKPPSNQFRSSNSRKVLKIGNPTTLSPSTRRPDLNHRHPNSFDELFPSLDKGQFGKFDKFMKYRNFAIPHQPLIHKLRSPTLNSKGQLVPPRSDPIHQLTKLLPQGTGFMLTYAPTFAPFSDISPSASASPYTNSNGNPVNSEILQLLKEYGVDPSQVEIKYGVDPSEGDSKGSESGITTTTDSKGQDDTEKFTRSAGPLNITEIIGTVEKSGNDAEFKEDKNLNTTVTSKPIYRIRATTTTTTSTTRMTTTTPRVTTTSTVSTTTLAPTKKVTKVTSTVKTTTKPTNKSTEKVTSTTMSTKKPKTSKSTTTARSKVPKKVYKSEEEFAKRSGSNSRTVPEPEIAKHDGNSGNNEDSEDNKEHEDKDEEKGQTVENLEHLEQTLPQNYENEAEDSPEIKEDDIPEEKSEDESDKNSEEEVAPKLIKELKPSRYLENIDQEDDQVSIEQDPTSKEDYTDLKDSKEIKELNSNSNEDLENQSFPIYFESTRTPEQEESEESNETKESKENDSSSKEEESVISKNKASVKNAISKSKSKSAKKRKIRIKPSIARKLRGKKRIQKVKKPEKHRRRI